MHIYGTLGPSCESHPVLMKMFHEGMTGIRVNMSHTTVQESSDQLALVRETAAKCGVVPEILIDMQGPEIRVGELPEPVELWEGERVILGEGGIPVPSFLPKAAVPGGGILLDDGKILLQTVTFTDTSITADVVRGGILQKHKSITMPGAEMHSPAVTKRDIENIRVAAENGVTGVMQPFVRGRSDLVELRQALKENGAGNLKVFAKIEDQQGIHKLKELLPEADEIVIARGDLGNSMNLWELPGVQKDIAATCREAGKPFIIVTQMLNSMETKPVPTRAEVSDIFNAVLDGADGVMITGESAIGKYPDKAIRYLARTARSAEEWMKKHEMPLL